MNTPTLFNFGLQEATYVDKFASFSQFDKFRKMNTRSNVNMIVDRFVPFTKAKNLKQPTKTIISVDETDIKGTSGAITMSVDDHGKNRNVVVNNDTLSFVMEDKVKREKEMEYFEGQMRYAYGSFSALSRCTSLTQQYIKDLDDGNISETYMETIEMAFNVANAVNNKYMPDIKNQYKDPILATVDTELGMFIDAAINDDESNDLYKVAKKSGRSGKDWAGIEAKLMQRINEDISSKAALTCASQPEILPSLKVFKGGEPQPQDYNTGKEACSVGNGSVDYDESPSFSEAPTQKDNKFEMSNDTLDSPQKTENEDRYFFNRRAHEDDLGLDKLDHLVDALYESLSGRLGKKKSQSPSRRLNNRAISSDISDNIYVAKNPIDGKNLHVNLIVDTSGSMSGHYIDDAVKIVHVFNELAYRGVVKGNIMLSSSAASGMWKFPMDRRLVPKIAAHNSGEGFKHTMAIRWREMQQADVNFALTDGQLTDGHISLEDFEDIGIEVTGMHVIRGAKGEDLIRYNGGLKRWFSGSVVRSSAEECIYTIVDQGLLKLGTGAK